MACSIELDAEAVAGGIGEGLADAEVTLRGEDGLVTEGQLNLFDGGMAAVGELGEGPPEVVGGEVDRELFGITADDKVYGVVSPNLGNF